MRIFLALLVSVVVALLDPLLSQDHGTARASVVPWYTVTDLGTLGGPGSQAFGLNNRGQVAGSADTDRRTKRGDLIAHAFLWQDGRMTELAPPHSLNGFAWAINNRGRVVGLTNAPNPYPFLWQNGRLTPLPAGDTPINIDDRGRMVGDAFLAQAPHAAVWRRGRRTVLRGTARDLWSSAADINRRGQIVGSAQRSARVSRALLWQGRRVIDLGTLGGPSSYATSVNDRGQIVGAADTRALDRRGFPVPHAALWQWGHITDLNSQLPARTGWELAHAAAINARGQIAGFGTLDGHTHAFLLTPRFRR